MKKFFITSILLLFLFLTLSFGSHLKVVYPDSISHGRAALIYGWYWLRTPGTWFEWHFPPDRDLFKIIYMNISALVTNKAGGGSGFSERVRWKIIDSSSGSTMLEGYINLNNPFLPKVQYNTNGLGYKVYGSVKIYVRSPDVLDTMRNNGFTFRITWPGVNKYHVAFNKNPKYLFLVYEKR
ncbi:MAG: hypothetical protein J7L28_05255 [Thermotogae bacterium]|nr:hypothetical protein [Thermotogota bacterium]